MKQNKKRDIAPSEYENRTDITSFILPDGLRVIGKYAFSGCTELTEVEIPDGITSVGANAFLDCSKLKYHTEGIFRFLGNNNNPRLVLVDVADNGESDSLTVPDGTTVIADSAFYCLFTLRNVTLPSSLKYIGDGAFYNCENLTSISVCSEIKSIGRIAFDRCESLAQVYYNGSEDQWRSVKIAPGNTRLKKAKVHFTVSPEAEIIDNCVPEE